MVYGPGNSVIITLFLGPESWYTQDLSQSIALAALDLAGQLPFDRGIIPWGTRVACSVIVAGSNPAGAIALVLLEWRKLANATP